MKSPADMLADIGRALHGERWLMRFSRDLEISDDTLSRWMTGRIPLPPDHGVFDDAARLLRAKEHDCANIRRELMRWMKRQDQ